MPVNTNVRLTFPDERERDDFEIAFRGWLKQYQKQATLSYGPGQQAQQPQPQQGEGLQASALGTGQEHTYGVTGQQGQQGQALFSWGGGSVSGTPYGSGQSGGIYLNFIGGW